MRRPSVYVSVHEWWYRLDTFYILQIQTPSLFSYYYYHVLHRAEVQADKIWCIEGSEFSVLDLMFFLAAGLDGVNISKGRITILARKTTKFRSLFHRVILPLL